MTKHDQYIVDKVKNAIIAVDKDCKIVLFGSRARGDAKKDSDWDFLVLTDLLNPEIERGLTRNVYDVELEESLAVQLIIRQKKEWETRCKITPLYKNIKKEGAILYG